MTRTPDRKAPRPPRDVVRRQSVRGCGVVTYAISPSRFGPVPPPMAKAGYDRRSDAVRIFVHPAFPTLPDLVQEAILCHEAAHVDLAHHAAGHADLFAQYEADDLAFERMGKPYRDGMYLYDTWMKRHLGLSDEEWAYRIERLHLPKDQRPYPRPPTEPLLDPAVVPAPPIADRRGRAHHKPRKG